MMFPLCSGKALRYDAPGGSIVMQKFPDIIAVTLIAILSLLPSGARAEPQVVAKEALGDWVLVGTVDKGRGEGACAINRGNDQGLTLGFVAERASRSWFLAVVGQGQGWNL